MKNETDDEGIVQTLKKLLKPYSLDIEFLFPSVKELRDTHQTYNLTEPQERQHCKLFVPLGKERKELYGKRGYQVLGKTAPLA